jgi:hypothetical protein
MLHIQAVIATCTVRRAVAVGENYELALFNGNGFATRLGAGALFVEQKFTA